MTVKEHLQALLNENLIRVEKIGSGNWYWVFGSEEKRRRLVELEGLKAELGKLQEVCTAVDTQVKAKKEADEELDDEEERTRLMDTKHVLNAEVASLEKELEGYRESDPGVVTALQEETGVMKEKAQRWTDNIDVVEGWLLEKMGGDREQMEALKREVYAMDYVEGEGLVEL